MDLLTFFLLLSVFLFTATLVELAWLAWSRSHLKERYAIKRRLLFISAGGRHGVEKLALYKNRALNDVSSLEKFAYSLPRVQKLDRMLLRSGLAINASSFLLASLALGGIGFLLGIRLLPHWTAAVGPGLVLLCLPIVWLKGRERQALAKFDDQLPEALDLLARSLRSGHAMSAGMEVISQEMEEPLKSEFIAAMDEINLGLSFREALENMCERVPSRDLRFFAVATLIQRDTGGNIAEILDQISTLTRERAKFKRHVNGLTAEGRLSGVILIGLPITLFIYFYFANYEYISLLWNDPIGYALTVFCIISMILGTIVIKNIVRIEI
ncbi:MAG: type II secretion system F family protein [Desulfuromonadales bacterium]|nr:type II secretion system F family protein [Desulfuromonadales bacterium]